MEISHQFKVTSLSVPSPTATHIASLSGTRLQIRSLSTLEIVRSIALPASQDTRTSQIRWSPPYIANALLLSTPDKEPQSLVSNRVLVADDENTRVFDLRDEKWSAVINNGSGGMGKNVHVDFGRTEDEVLVWSDFASKVTVWCLRTGRTVEIKDPKFSGKDGRGWGYRPCENGETGVLALLCRSNGQDVLMLVAAGSYRVLRRVELVTVDAQGIRWSRDGRWIAVWDSPGAGYRVCVYTADGHLYRTIGEDRAEGDIEGLGVKSVEWAPGGQYLAVGGWDSRVRMFSSTTFSPTLTLSHTPTIHMPATPIYTEQVSSSGTRSHTLTTQPISPPTATSIPNETAPKQGISLIVFSCDGALAATREDSTPTTLWLWDLRVFRPKIICIQHAPIKNLLWHPTIPSLLLIQCAHDEATLYLWSASASIPPDLMSSVSIAPPEIISLNAKLTKPAGSAATKWDVKWLPTPADKKPGFLFGHQQGYILVWPEGRDLILRFENGDGGEESEDSLFEILTGKKEVPSLEEREGYAWIEGGEREGEEEESTARLEDTFRERRRTRGVVGQKREEREEREEFYESGMSEMF